MVRLPSFWTAGTVDVVLVDDNPAVLISTAAVLRSFDLTVDAVQTLSEAEAIVRLQSVGVAILDYDDAVAWARGAVHDAPWPPVVVLSGRLPDALRCLDEEYPGSFFTLLGKPAMPAILFNTVMSAIALGASADSHRSTRV